MWDPFGPHKEKFDQEVYNSKISNCILSPGYPQVSDFCEIVYNPGVSDLLRAWVRE
jgi:hypothetical protein